MKKLSVVLALCAGAITTLIRAEESPDSGLPKVSAVASDPVAFQGLTTGSFTLYRHDTNGDLAVSIKLSGSASNGVDYATIPNSATIPAGFHAVGLVVQPLGTGGITPNKWVTLTIETNVNYEIGRSHAKVLIRGNAFENDAPAVSITSPADDSTIAAHSDLTITADASDDDAVTKVNFYANDRLLGSVSNAPYSLVWSNVPAGKFALFARAIDQLGKSTLSSAVHVRATNPAPVVSVTINSPTNGSSFVAGSNIPVEAAVQDAAATESVSFYAGDRLLGSVSSAPFSLTWSNVPPGRYSLRAKAQDTNGAVAISESVKITISNTPPAVTITSPTNSTSYVSPTDVTITADASDDNGVKNVMFFGDFRFLGISATAPYSLTWSNVPPGNHTLLAVATDSFGTKGISPAVHITVSNTAPTLTLTAPADGSMFTAPAKIELQADASDANGVKAVVFWSGKRLLGVDYGAPYSLTLNNVKAGTYTFKATAYDRYWKATSSAPVTVTVNEPTP